MGGNQPLSQHSQRGARAPAGRQEHNSDWYTRDAVSYHIKGRTWLDPPEDVLLSMAEGDTAAALAPKEAKCEQYGTCYGTDPITFPFHDHELNAARWLRDVELRAPCHGDDRHHTSLFGQANGQPFTDTHFHEVVRGTLTVVLGATPAAAFSPHSWRVWLASSLRMVGATDAQIQALGR